jgi:hypothetical protein
MPSTDTKPELTAKASMAQPVSQPAVYANGLNYSHNKDLGTITQRRRQKCYAVQIFPNLFDVKADGSRPHHCAFCMVKQDGTNHGICLHQNLFDKAGYKHTVYLQLAITASRNEQSRSVFFSFQGTWDEVRAFWTSQEDV